MNGPAPNAHELVFDIRRSIRYHHRRRRHYQNIHNAVLFVALVSNSAAITAMWSGLLPTQSFAAILPGVVVSVLIGFDFVIGSLQKSGLHTDLARQFTELEKQLVGVTDDDIELLAGVQRQRLTIEVTEPPILQVLDTLCYNDEVRAQGYDKGRQIPVGAVQRFVADFFDLGAEGLYKTANQ